MTKIVRVVRLFMKLFFKSALAYIILMIVSNGLYAQDFPGFHIYDPENDSITALTDSLSFQTDSLSLASDSTKKEKINPMDTIELFHSGLYIKIDYGKILTYPTKFESKLEGSVGVILFRRLVLNGTYGLATLDPLKAYKNVEYYTIEGDYMKFGLGYYFAINPKNYFTIEAKYAMANYSDKGKFLIGSDFFNDFEGEFGSENLSADWFELVIDSETEFKKNLYLGIQLSLRIMHEFETREDIPVYTVPGYGRTFDKTTPAASLFIKYKIPFN